jgi:hypothetical protein
MEQGNVDTEGQGLTRVPEFTGLLVRTVFKSPPHFAAINKLRQGDLLR